MLQRLNRLQQPRTTFMNKQCRPYAARFWFFPNRALALPVAESLQNFAHPFTRSVFATRNVIPSRAYCAAMVVPSLCRGNTSAPATNLFKSEVCNLRSRNFRPEIPIICQESEESVRKAAPEKAFSEVKKWCAWRELNPQPSPSEGATLSN